MLVHQNRTSNRLGHLQRARTSNLFGQKQAEPRNKSEKQNELRALTNPGSFIKTELRTHPSKNPETRTHELGSTNHENVLFSREISSSRLVCFPQGCKF